MVTKNNEMGRNLAKGGPAQNFIPAAYQCSKDVHSCTQRQESKHCTLVESPIQAEILKTSRILGFSVFKEHQGSDMNSK